MEGKYKSESAARKARNKNLNTVIVEFSDGMFDWFPQGHPIGDFQQVAGKGRQFVRAEGYEIVERFNAD